MLAKIQAGMERIEQRLDDAIEKADDLLDASERWERSFEGMKGAAGFGTLLRAAFKR